MGSALQPDANISSATELRVHGIGLHEAYSVLGEANILEGSPDDVGTYSFDGLRTSAIAFIWSRVTRRVGLFWYLGLPFSLINTAGFMVLGPKTKHRPELAVFIYAAVAAVTGTYLLWALAALDTITTFIRSPGWWAVVRYGGLAFILGSFLLPWAFRYFGLIVLRWSRKRKAIPEEDSSPLLEMVNDSTTRAGTLIHVATTFGTLGFLLWNEPFKTGTDVLLPSAFLSMTVLLIAALLLFPASWLARGAKSAEVKADVAGISVCGLSLLLVHLYWSSFRNALEWILTYIDSLSFVPGIYRFSLRLGETVRDRFVLTIFRTSESSLFRPDLVPPGIVTAVLVWSIIAAIVVFGYKRIGQKNRLASVERDYANGPYPNVDKRRLARARWHENVLEGMTPVLALGIMLIVFSSTSLGVALFLTEELSRNVLSVDGIRASVHISAILAVALLLAFLNGSFREKASPLFDLAGYWPRRYHLMAGEPYGPAVVSALREKIVASRVTGPVVVVGHSQGSVLAFDAVSGLPEDNRSGVHLVTCGSPLNRLYSRFFPYSFAKSRYIALIDAGVPWINFHRDTDAIASKIQGPRNVLLLDTGRPRSRKLLKHSGYWNDSDLNRTVDHMLTSGEIVLPTDVAATTNE